MNLEGLMDEDGLTEASYVFQWYRGETAIEGAVYRSYLLEQVDVGESISVKVTVTDDEGHVGSVSVAVEQLIENVDNPVLGRVKILGTVHEQETITANLEGLTDEDGLADDDSFVYVWFRDGVEIEGEMGQELSIEDEWVGSTISVEVSFADLLGNEYKSRSFEREVYEARIPRIREAILTVDEGVMGSIGMLDVDFRGRGELSYTVASPYDVVVRVNSAGEVALLSALDYENRTSLDVLITVMSEAELNSSEEISINVRDVDDESPSGIELLDDVGNVLLVYEAREGDIGVVGTLRAMDVDTASEGLSYSTSDGRFSIEETSVESNIYVLKSSVSLDYEGGGVTNGTIMIEITVSDGTNDATSEILTISVIDVDDVFPSMIRLEDNMMREVENVIASEGTISLLGTLVATDADTAREDLIYEIDDDRFSVEQRMDGTTNYYVLSSAVLLNYEAAEVVDETTVVEITVTDGGMNVTRERLKITVEDRADEAPENLRILSEEKVKEGEVGVVGTLKADDLDTASEDLVYSIGEVDGDFDIEVVTVASVDYYVLKSKSSLDYEDVGLVDNGTTMVAVTVTDGLFPIIGNLVVTVIDANDNEPVMSYTNLANTPLREDLADATVIGMISVEDEDRTIAHRTISYMVDDDKFSVDASTGDVYFSVFEISGDDLEVRTTITASDGLNSDTIEVMVTIDNSDNSQDVRISDQTLRVEEGMQDLSRAVVATGEDISFSVVSSDFEIGSDTGILRFKSVPDYEDASQRSYNVIVTVRSGTSDASATVSVLVEDVNDNAPTGLDFLDGGVPVVNIVVAEDDIGVFGTLEGIDVDTVGTFDYRISDTRFSVEQLLMGMEVHHTLRARDTLDYELEEVSNSGTVVLEVTVDDGGNRADSTIVEELTITVRDVDDEAPYGLKLVDVDGVEIADPVGDEAGDGLVGTLTAEDVDTVEGDLMYGTGDSRFRVVETGVGTGIYELRTNDFLDYEDNLRVVGGTTRVRLTVEDMGGNSEVISLEVSVRDVDDEDPANLRLVDDVGVGVLNAEGEEGGVNDVGILTADDVDTAGTDLSYTTADVRFRIEETGVGTNIYMLKTEVGLDYDDSTMVMGETTMVEITVMDMGNNSFVDSLTITVLDVDDELPSMIRLLDGSGGVIGTIEAEEEKEMILGTLMATDVDTLASELVYRLVDDRFMIEKIGVNYVLKSLEMLDYEGVEVMDGTMVLGGDS